MPKDSYTKLSRSYRVSVPAMKKVLTDAGYLEGKVPSPKALREGVAEIIHIEGGRFSQEANQMVLWDTETVSRLFAAQGVLEVEPGTKVHSGHSAADRLHEAGDLLDESLGLDLESGNNRSAATDACGDFLFGGVNVLGFVADLQWTEALRWVSDRRQVFALHAAEIKLTKTKAAKFGQAMRKISAVEAWLSRPRRKRSAASFEVRCRPNANS